MFVLKCSPNPLSEVSLALWLCDKERGEQNTSIINAWYPWWQLRGKLFTVKAVIVLYKDTYSKTDDGMLPLRKEKHNFLLKRLGGGGGEETEIFNK